MYVDIRSEMKCFAEIAMRMHDRKSLGIELSVLLMSEIQNPKKFNNGSTKIKNQWNGLKILGAQ